jgi:hypothetical protein
MTVICDLGNRHHLIALDHARGDHKLKNAIDLGAFVV